MESTQKGCYEHRVYGQRSKLAPHPPPSPGPLCTVCSLCIQPLFTNPRSFLDFAMAYPPLPGNYFPTESPWQSLIVTTADRNSALRKLSALRLLLTTVRSRWYHIWFHARLRVFRSIEGATRMASSWQNQPLRRDGVGRILGVSRLNCASLPESSSLGFRLQGML